MQYDSNFIYEFSRRLYARANSMILSNTLFGGLIGGAGGWYVGWINFEDVYITSLIAAISTLLFGVIGFRIGTNRAFRYKLEAQVALCQVQIEENTRVVTVPDSSQSQTAEAHQNNDVPPIIS